MYFNFWYTYMGNGKWVRNNLFPTEQEYYNQLIKCV